MKNHSLLKKPQMRGADRCAAETYRKVRRTTTRGPQRSRWGFFSRLLAALALGLCLAGSAAADSEPVVGVLVLAHGGTPLWNKTVLQTCKALEVRYPTAVAFGMADPKTIEPAVKTLLKRGVTRIVAIPFFISAYSDILGDSRYVLGLADHPATQVPLPAKGGHVHSKLYPISISVPVAFGEPLGRSPEAAEVLLERAKEMSRKPSQEIVVLVAHGPVTEEDDAKWIADLKWLADPIAEGGGFRRVDVATLRDDAPPVVRDQATLELRRLVRSASQEAACLVVPVLLAPGGIEQKIPWRLAGLRYRFTGRTLLPHPELEAWLLHAVQKILSQN